MRYRHQHGDIGDWVLYGIAFAFGWIVLKIFVGLVVLACVVVWELSKSWSPFWRDTTRTIFVIVLTMFVMLLAAIIFAE